MPPSSRGGWLQPPLDLALRELAVGATSEVIETDRGFYLLHRTR